MTPASRAPSTLQPYDTKAADGKGRGVGKRLFTDILLNDI